MNNQTAAKDITSDEDIADVKNTMPEEEYAEDIYNFHKSIEHLNRPIDYIDRQVEMTKKLRNVVADWVCLEAYYQEAGRAGRDGKLSDSAPASGSVAPAISVTDKALNHLNKMRSEKNEDLRLRIGVKQGSCSGMSYTMEFESQANARPDDSIMEYNGFVIVDKEKGILKIADLGLGRASQFLSRATLTRLLLSGLELLRCCWEQPTTQLE